MTVQSMTGFSRSQGVSEGASWAWEIRSVNGKGLDIRLRLPREFDRLEPQIRKIIAAPLKRGNIQAALSIVFETDNGVPTINQAVLDGVLRAAKMVDDNIATAPSTAAEFLALRGVLEIADTALDEKTRGEIETAILGGLEQAVADLVTHREQEGKALVEVLLGNVDEIERLTRAADADPCRSPAAIRQKLKTQVALLREAGDSLNEDRLHQEAAILATKADIREEIDRLFTHGESARQLLTGKGPIGRKLDFLCQEFNRESNTLCAKANAASVTNLGLELKVIIDQFREQVQNLE